MNQEVLNEILNFVECGYLVTSHIVQSGQRVVYRASKTVDDGTSYVLKTSPVYPESVARIQRELKILEEINSPYFPRSIHNQFISSEDIQYFIDNFDPKTQLEKIRNLQSLDLRPFFVTVEEYIVHQNWGNCIPSFQGNEQELVKFLRHLFTGANLLWDKKIVHRDLKPENILIRNNAEPVIIDLGIAKSMREGTQAITRVFGFSPCTPQFAAPEQLTNNKAEVTYKSDQFSIGVIIYWVMTGRFPFGSINHIGPETFMRNIQANNITDAKTINPNISDNLNNFINKLLSIQPYQRYRNVEAIFAALESIGA